MIITILNKQLLFQFNSIQIICKQLNSFKYFYLPLMILFDINHSFNTDVWFHVFLFNSDNFQT